MRQEKEVILTGSAGEIHWVGDGFPVRTVFSHHVYGEEISPFLLLDYAAPERFDPSAHVRGVGWHPHRGFETVTIVYQGEVEHEDSAGNRGRIGPGDVQWMTAARGLSHKEFHGKEFTLDGGVLQMAQLWVNLPAKDKRAAPRYQEILNASIPVVTLPGGAGAVRVIAGEYGSVRGAADTFTPINVWDVRLNAGEPILVPVADGQRGILVVLSGMVRVNGSEATKAGELVLLARDGDAVSLKAEEDSVALFLSGEPIDEPVAAHGPFVMNTYDEIREAMEDYDAGKF